MRKLIDGYYGVAFVCSFIVLALLALLSTPFPTLIAGMAALLDGIAPTTAGRLVYIGLGLILMAFIWFVVSRISNLQARAWVGHAAGTLAVINILLDILTLAMKATWVDSWIAASAGIVERFIFVANKGHLSEATLMPLGSMFVLLQIFTLVLVFGKLTRSSGY